MGSVIREEVCTASLVQEVIRYHARPSIGYAHVSEIDRQRGEGVTGSAHLDRDGRGLATYIPVYPLAKTLPRMLS